MPWSLSNNSPIWNADYYFFAVKLWDAHNANIAPPHMLCRVKHIAVITEYYSAEQIELTTSAFPSKFLQFLLLHYLKPAQ